MNDQAGDFFHNWDNRFGLGYYVLSHYDYRDSMDGEGGPGRPLESQKGVRAAKINKYPIIADLINQGSFGAFHDGKFNVTLGDGSVHLLGGQKASLIVEFFFDHPDADDIAFYRFLDDFFGVSRWEPIQDGYPYGDAYRGSPDDPPL